ncbi:adapter protein MecA 1/2 [Eubacterium ruminantium]|nr:adapter protein MecA 1/2 [Eubacterium ruminantium]
MKIEKINDNQIRCILNKQELEDKNIRLTELAYGTDKAKELFHDMIRQAAEEVDFEVDGSPLMIEAIPTNKDTLILIVTKVDNPDELDARFSRFTHLSEDDDLDMLSEDEDDIELNFDSEEEASDDILDSDSQEKESSEEISDPQDTADNKSEEASANETSDTAEDINDILNSDSIQKKMKDGLSNLFAGITNALENLAGNAIKNGDLSLDPANAHISADVTITASPGNKNKPPSDSPFEVFMFKDISDVINAAYEISSLYFSDNTLYKDEMTGRFYLYATSNANTATSFEEVQKILLKYSLKCRTTYASISYYNEHFKVIRRKNAMQLLATI